MIVFVGFGFFWLFVICFWVELVMVGFGVFFYCGVWVVCFVGNLVLCFLLCCI